MDGRHALPGVAPDGGQRLDQISLGGDGERAQAQILFHQKGRPPNPQEEARTMDGDFHGSRRALERKTKLTSNPPSRNGGGRCWPRVSKPAGVWMNWKVICGRKSAQ